MQKLLACIEKAKQIFHRRLQILEGCGMSEEIYVRYLSFQYHLTKGVQRHFLTIAAHPQLADKRSLREFLFRFALEEEPHFKVAEADLRALKKSPLPCPLDVSLWWAYFNEIVKYRPLVRLGATTILENLGAGAGDLGHALLENAPYLNSYNTRFLTIHFHEALPHGDQILQALSAVKLSDSDWEDLLEGAQIGAIQYMRFVDWALKTSDLTVKEFDGTSSIDYNNPEGNYLDLPNLLNPDV